MGIAAVAAVAHLVAAGGEVLRQGRRRGWPAKVRTDGGVVGGGMTEGDRGKMTPKRRRNTARVLERGKDGRIIARPHHWKDVVVVLRRARSNVTPPISIDSMVCARSAPEDTVSTKG